MPSGTTTANDKLRVLSALGSAPQNIGGAEPRRCARDDGNCTDIPYQCGWLVAAGSRRVSLGDESLRVCGRRVSFCGRQAGALLGSAAPVREVLVNEIDDSVTGMIHAWNAGDAGAGTRLFSRVYGELRSIARSTRRRRPEHGDETLDTTALIHEVYLRLAGANELTVQNRGHFFAVAVRAARQIVSNHARDAQTLKRGGGAVTAALDDIAAQQLAPPALDDDRSERISALEEALQQLERLHPRPCRVVECRYFGGLSITDTALALKISEATVKRDWVVAQAWLHRALREYGAIDAE